MRELRQFRLPQLVEARKKEDGETRVESPEFGASGNALHLTQSSASSDYPSPVTPTFSLRGHSRFPSSTSSLASSPVLCDSMDTFGSGKRPLTDVKEEPHERDEDFEMLDDPNDALDCFCKLCAITQGASAACAQPQDLPLTDRTPQVARRPTKGRKLGLRAPPFSCRAQPITNLPTDP